MFWFACLFVFVYFCFVFVVCLLLLLLLLLLLFFPRDSDRLVFTAPYLYLLRNVPSAKCPSTSYTKYNTNVRHFMLISPSNTDMRLANGNSNVINERKRKRDFTLVFHVSLIECKLQHRYCHFFSYKALIILTE